MQPTMLVTVSPSRAVLSALRERKRMKLLQPRTLKAELLNANTAKTKSRQGWIFLSLSGNLRKIKTATTVVAVGGINMKAYPIYTRPKYFVGDKVLYILNTGFANVLRYATIRGIRQDETGTPEGPKTFIQYDVSKPGDQSKYLSEEFVSDNLIDLVKQMLCNLQVNKPGLSYTVDLEKIVNQIELNLVHDRGDIKTKFNLKIVNSTLMEEWE